MIMETVREYGEWALEKLWRCCSGSNDEEDDGLIGERTRLIRDSDRSGHQHHVSRVSERLRRNEDFAISRQSVRNKVSDDTQNSLNKILNQTTANIIDIGLIGQTPGVLEQQDVSERCEVYQKRLASVGTKIAAKHALEKSSREENNKLKILNESEVDACDIELARGISRRVEEMMKKMRVEQSESIVVTFGAGRES